jgi:hypothetical protein
MSDWAGNATIPVYCEQDIAGFKDYINSKKQELMNCNTKKELNNALRRLKRTYYSNCHPIGYV